MEQENLPTLEVLEEINYSFPVQVTVEKMRAAGLELPDFMLEDHGAKLENRILAYNEVLGYYIKPKEQAPYGEIEVDYTTFKTLEEVSKYLSKNPFILEFDHSLFYHNPDNLKTIGGIAFYPLDNGNYGTIRSATDEEDMQMDAYLSFLIAFREWEKVQNVATAWQFLETHPTFWRKHVTSTGEYWNMEEGMAIASISVYVDEKTSEIHAHIETGSIDPKIELPEQILGCSFRHMQAYVRRISYAAC